MEASTAIVLPVVANEVLMVVNQAGQEDTHAQGSESAKVTKFLI